MDFSPEQMTAHLAACAGPALFRLAWWNHLDPSRRHKFKEDLFSIITEGIIRAFELSSGMPAPPADKKLAAIVIGSLIEHAHSVSTEPFRGFDDGSFEKTAERIRGSRNESKLNELFAHQFDRFTSRTAEISSSLIVAANLLTEEWIIWLKTHPSDTERMHSDAFEQLTGEILTSHGFTVEFTGRIKNKSADLFAVGKDDDGAMAKYLIECKRYSSQQKVNLHILNAVIGSSFRAKTDHAMLVTTSSFTRNVHQVRAELEDFRLELHDGKRVTEWLANYKFRDDLGLWLPEGWQDQWKTDIG